MISTIFLISLGPTVLCFQLYNNSERGISILVVVKNIMQAGPSFKVILVGDSGAGKTSLIRKYIHGMFKDEYEVTVGVDFYSKTITVEKEPVQLQIWDTCGQDIYKSVTSNFYRGAAAVFMVFSVNNVKSFEHLNQWLIDFQEKGSKQAFVFLIGAKCDLQHQVQPDKAFQFMKDVGGAFFIETSSKNDEKVEELFQKAAETMFKAFKVSNQFRQLVCPDRSSVPLQIFPKTQQTEDKQEVQKKKKCCS